MKAVTKILASGAALAALFAAAPAAAQYYPGYGYPGYGNPIGQVLGQVLGNGYNGYGAYGVNSQAVVNQCVNAVQARLNGGYAGYGASPYGYGNARVLGISRVEQRSGGGLTVRGVANSGRSAYAYNGQAQVDLTWKCRSDYRGYVYDIDVTPARTNYGYAPNNNYVPYTNNGYDYSQYGYQRY